MSSNVSDSPVIKDYLNNIKNNLSGNFNHSRPNYDYDKRDNISLIIKHIIHVRYGLTNSHKFTSFHNNVYHFMHEFISNKHKELVKFYPENLYYNKFNLNCPKVEEFYMNCIKYVEFIRLSNNVKFFVQPSFDFVWSEQLKTDKNEINEARIYLDTIKNLKDEIKQIKEEKEIWSIKAKRNYSDMKKQIDELQLKCKHFENEKTILISNVSKVANQLNKIVQEN